MKLFLFFLNAFLAINLPVNTKLPEKLRMFQNVTGISDRELLEIHESALKGITKGAEVLKVKRLKRAWFDSNRSRTLPSPLKCLYYEKLWEYYIYLCVKTQIVSWHFTEVMAECPLREHPTPNPDSSIVIKQIMPTFTQNFDWQVPRHQVTSIPSTFKEKCITFNPNLLQVFFFAAYLDFINSRRQWVPLARVILDLK